MCRDDGGCTAGVTVSGSEDAPDPPVTERILDLVDGHWIGVNTVPYECARPDGTKIDTVKWLITDIEPRPDGTLAGTYRSGTEIGPYDDEFPITVTRTGDADPDVKVGDPAVLPARVASPAEALWGTYHLTETLKGSVNPPAVHVHSPAIPNACATGDRCLTFMPSPEDSEDVLTLVYADGHWSQNNWFPRSKCAVSGEATLTRTINLPLPEPRQDPITLLTGTERLEFGRPAQNVLTPT